MMSSFLFRTLGRAASTAGALTLLGVACGCTISPTGLGGAGGSGGSPGQQACVAATKSGSSSPISPWSRQYPIQLNAMDADPGGGLFLGGGYSGSPDLGLGSLAVASNRGDVVAKVSPDGTVLWNHAWSDASGAIALAADSCGDVFVARVLASRQGDEPDYGNQKLWLAKLDSQGELLWEHSYPDEPSYQVFRLLVDARGDVVMSGHIDGTLDLGDPILTATGGATGFVGIFAGGTGETRWTRPIKAASSIGIGVEASGDLYVTGDISRFGGAGVLPQATPDGSLPLARLDPSGQLKAITRTGPSPDSTGKRGSFMVSPQGAVAAAEVCRTLDDMPAWCLLRFTSDGAPAARQIVGAQDPWLPISWSPAPQVTFDPQGNVVMLNAAVKVVKSTSSVSRFLNLTRMSPTGAILRAESWPSGSPVETYALRVDASGGVVFAVTADSGINVGDGPELGSFVARHAP